MMRRGTKLGWAMIGLSVILCGWTIAGSTITDAEGETEPPVEAVSEAPVEESPVVDAAEPAALSLEDDYEPSMEELMALNDGISLAMADGSYEKYTIQDGVVIFDKDNVTIGSSEFYNDPDIKGVKVQANNVTIGSNAFGGCTNLKNVDMGTATIGNGGTASTAFAGCYSIESFTGSGAGYSMNDGVVYSGSGSNVEMITAGALQGDVIYLPASVLSVDSGAFDSIAANCKNVIIMPVDGYNTQDLVNKLEPILAYKGIDVTPWEPGNPTPTPGPSPSPTTTPDPSKPTPTPVPGGGGSGGGGSSGGGSSSGGSGGGSSSDSSGVSTTVTYTITSDGQVVKGHTQSATPKTADGFDERYLLSLSIFFCGLGFILYSRNRKYTMISELSDRD